MFDLINKKSILMLRKRVRDKSDFKRTNYEGTCTMLQEAARCDSEVVVHTSTESIFAGKSRLAAKAGVGVQHGAVYDLPGHYSRSKLLAEQAALGAAEGGMPVVICDTPSTESTVNRRSIGALPAVFWQRKSN